MKTASPTFSRWLVALFCFSSVTLQLMAGDLQNIDKVKVEAIKSSSGRIQKVITTKLFQADMARRLVNQWNSLKLLSVETDCIPRPAYRLSFYRKGDELYRRATVCFDCDTITLLDSKTSDDLGGSDAVFENNENAQHLRHLLAQLFPGHDPKTDASHN